MGLDRGDSTEVGIIRNAYCRICYIYRTYAHKVWLLWYASRYF